MKLLINIFRIPNVGMKRRSRRSDDGGGSSSSSHRNISKYKYKVVCLSVCMSNRTSETPGPICLTFCLRNSGDPQKIEKNKIVIYDKLRVIGGTNYRLPWALLGSQSSMNIK